MLGRGRTLSYANVVSTLALLLALGGGVVYAASKINGKTIKKASTPGNRLKPDTVTGAQVKESTLGSVPLAASANTALSADSATSAENAKSADAAQSVGGVREHVVHVSAPNPAVGFTDTPVDSTGGMQTVLRCQNDGTSGIVIKGSASNDRGLIEGVAYNPGATAVAVPFSDSAAGVATNGALTAVGGSATMRAQSGAEIRFDFQVYEALDGFGTNDDCWVDGFVRSTP